MASKKITGRAFIHTGNTDVLWFETKEDKTIFHLPKNNEYRKAMLKNIGIHMSSFATAHPNNNLLTN